jgi:hypothetical protein
MTMNRIAYLWLAAIVLAGMLISSSSAQNSGGQNASPQVSATPATNPPDPSLGSYARALRKDKKQQAAKHFDNDNLPRQDKLNVVGESDSAQSSAANTPDQQTSPANSKSTDKSAMPAVTPGETAEQRQQVFDQWKGRISSQQSEIDLLSRELDVTQREYKMRAAEFYSDAGERLRNQASWDKADADYKQEIADKQKALDEAKQKLGDMQEDARRAGVPSSARDSEQPEQQQ